MTELPKSELDAFIETVAAAQNLASAGHVLAGYCCLLAGLAQALNPQEGEKLWGRALARGYRTALDRYGAEWGLRIE